MAQKDIAFWLSEETGDWMSPDTIPPDCTLSIRARESGEIIDLNAVALEKTRIVEHPSAYWFVIGIRVSCDLPKVSPTPFPTSAQVEKGTRRLQEADSSRARGSNDP
jgi:hypothetical protein